jgi:ABC-2 type transport system ATP-binding protein
VEGTPRDLIAGLNGRVLELAADPQAAASQIAALDPDVEDVHTFGSYIHLRVSRPEGPVSRLPVLLAEAGISLHHIQPVTPTLEDVFIQLLETEGKTDVH